jgi:hypothetical protein
MHFVRRYLHVLSDLRICFDCFRDIEYALYIRLYEFKRRPVYAPVYMGFSGEVDDIIRFVFFESLIDFFLVDDIALYEMIIKRFVLRDVFVVSLSKLTILAFGCLEKI